MKIKIIISLLVLFTANSYSQTHHYFSLKDDVLKKDTYKTLLSAGVGLEYADTYSGWDYSINFNIEVTPHLGKGYYIGVGLNNHELPINRGNNATYLYSYFSKSFYLIKKLAIYPGLGATIGLTSKGHPGCCVGGAYGVFSVIYELAKYFGFGINTQIFTDFKDLNIIPGIRISARF